MPHVTANGIRLYYEERGAGAPILGLHGAGSSAVFWEDAAERLAALGRVIIYDRRPRGRRPCDRPGGAGDRRVRRRGPRGSSAYVDSHA